MSTQDEVKLSVHERHKLARMQATLQAADPRLARVLRHDAALEPDGPPPAWRHSRHRFVGNLVRVWVGLVRVWVGLVRVWVGVIVVVAGLALIMVTVASALWLSVLGSLITAAGLGLSGKAFERHRALQARALRAKTDVAG